MTTLENIVKAQHDERQRINRAIEEWFGDPCADIELLGDKYNVDPADISDALDEIEQMEPEQ